MREMSTPKPSHPLGVSIDHDPNNLFAFFDSLADSKKPVAPKDKTGDNKNGDKHQDVLGVHHQQGPEEHPFLIFS